MALLKKILCLVCCISLVMLSSCSGDGGNNSDSADNNGSLGSNSIGYVSNPIDYSFPEFLESTEDISIFSHMVYWNMEGCNIAIDADDQSIDGYFCDLSFSSGMLYRYQYNGLYGIVDSQGNEKLNPSYTSIIQIRPDLLELVTDEETIYASIDEEFNISIVNDKSYDWIFQKSQITVIRNIVQSDESATDSSNTAKYTLKTADGNNIFQQSFDSVAELSKEDYEFDCEYIYNAYLNGANYLIVIDKYYNYRVFEGDYATVNVVIDGREGSCYVLSYDHFVEISSLTDSFKYTETRKNNDTDEDYVRIIFGDNEQSEVLLMYADGYTEQSLFDAELNEMVTSYYKIDKEAFADVVDWITRVLSTEYVTEEE